MNKASVLINDSVPICDNRTFFLRKLSNMGSYLFSKYVCFLNFIYYTLQVLNEIKNLANARTL